MALSGINAFEQGIIQRLQEKLPDITVKSFGDKLASADFMAAQNEIFVNYMGATYDKPTNFNCSYIQKEHKSFDLTVISRELTEENSGIYGILDRIKAALFGATLPTGEKILYLAENFEDYQNDCWIYRVQIEITTNYIKEK